jgi:hypothetical protein
MNYTHILNIKIADLNDNLLENKNLLNNIKLELVDKLIKHQFTHHHKNINLSIKWHKIHWKKPYNYFVGDLYCDCNSDFDIMVYEHTKYSLDHIEKKIKLEHIDSYGTDWKIVFHISKEIGYTLPH